MTGIHRKIKKVLMLILFTCLFVLPAAASSSEDVLDEQSKALGLDKLAEAAGEYSPGDTVTGVDLDAGLQDLLDSAILWVSSRFLTAEPRLLAASMISPASRSFMVFSLRARE